MYPIVREKRYTGEVIKQNCFIWEEKGKKEELEYLTFPLLEQTGMVNHLFTTRLGGVSEGIYHSMSLSFLRGDKEECVRENYRRIGLVMGISPENMVTSKQTHTTNIRLVTKEDAGRGVTKPLNYDNVDGLITKEKGLALVTSYADCVPLYFVDTKEQAIGLAHSGWRGTVNKMGACMVQKMNETFGSKPENIWAAIGPSICQECYEVSEEVAEAFSSLFSDTKEILQEIRKTNCYASKEGENRQVILPGKKQGKYQLDLWLANLVILAKSGIPIRQIAVTDICTCHNPKYLFSHRASQGKRGSLSAFLMLREF